MKTTIILVGLAGFLAVALGAFGAHGLEPHMSIEQQEWFETANRYHFYHVLSALALLVWYILRPQPLLLYGIALFLFGILLFSGSLYLMATHSILGIPKLSWLGPITPLGGLFFLAGWLTVAWAGIKSVQ